MNNNSITYFDEQQKLIGELFLTEKSSGKKPAIILFPAFEGRSEFVLNYAKKLAEQGYIAFVADIYGDAASADTIEGCFALIKPFLADRALVRRRAVLAFETLLQQNNVDASKMSAIGFCFGGMCVLELARSGVDLHAGVTMHGVLAKSALPTHPIRSKLLILHGYQDPQVPPTQLPAFAAEMNEAGVTDWTVTFFGDAAHSFTDPKTGTYDPTKEKEMGRAYSAVAAARSYRYALDFFEE